MIVICHYPLQLHPARESAMSLWYQYGNAPHASSPSITPSSVSTSASLSSMVSASPIHKHAPIPTDIEEDIDDGYGEALEDHDTTTNRSSTNRRNMQIEMIKEGEEEESIVFHHVRSSKQPDEEANVPSQPEQQLTIRKLLPPDVYQRRYIICTVRT
jgi:hypothetical protein